LTHILESSLSGELIWRVVYLESLSGDKKKEKALKLSLFKINKLI